MGGSPCPFAPRVSIADGEPLAGAGAELRTYLSESAAISAPFVRILTSPSKPSCDILNRP